jgi:RNA polymerase sigma factor (sigma-70 family)
MYRGKMENDITAVESVENLVRKYNDRLLKVLGPLTSWDDQLDDIVQEVWIKVLRALPGFRNKSHIFTWIYRIGVNTAINYLKKHRKPERDLESVEPRSRNEPESEYDRKRIRTALNRALVLLGPRQREVFILRHFDDLPFDEIRKILSITSVAARVDHYHAVRKVRKELVRQGISPDMVAGGGI